MRQVIGRTSADTVMVPDANLVPFQADTLGGIAPARQLRRHGDTLVLTDRQLESHLHQRRAASPARGPRAARRRRNPLRPSGGARILPARTSLRRWPKLRPSNITPGKVPFLPDVVFFGGGAGPAAQAVSRGRLQGSGPDCGRRFPGPSAARGRDARWCGSPYNWCAAGRCWAARPAPRPGWYTHLLRSRRARPAPSGNRRG